MIYIISFCFLIVVVIIISIALAWYFNYKSNSKSEKSFFSATVNILKKYYSGIETLENTTLKSGGEKATVYNLFDDKNFTVTDKSISIWNDIVSLISSDDYSKFFKDCRDSRKSNSVKCYINYKEYIGEPLSDDTAIALYLLDYAYIFETHKNDSEFIKEVGNKQLTDIISYNKDSKTVTVNSSDILPIGTYSLNDFMKKYKELNKLKKTTDGNMVSILSCQICGKDAITI